MSEQLVIRLGNHTSDPVQWLVWSNTENEIIASGELPSSDQLNTLAQRAGGRAIIGLVPGSDILLRNVTLPKSVGRKALAAIPYILEDEISGDVEDQFFAMGGKDGQEYQVAVTESAQLQQWLDLIADAGLNCAKLIPDIFAVPFNEDGWAAMSLGGQLIIRQGNWQGIQGEESWLKPLIENYASAQSEPLNLAWYSETDWQDITNINLSNVAQDLPMEVLAKEAIASKFNLLQGDFKPKRESSGLWKKWRVAAILAGLAISTTLVDKIVTASALGTQNQLLTEQIRAEFKKAFPEVNRVVNVRAQMNQKIKELELNGGGDISILLMITQLSDAFSSSQVKPQSIRFDSKRGELRIQTSAPSFEALEKFKQVAESSGFEVLQGAINNRDNGVVGSLTIKS